MRNVLKISELRTLVATVLPSMIGIMFSIIFYGNCKFLLSVLMILSACCIQMATNVINDYSDLKKEKTHLIDVLVEGEKAMLSHENEKFYKKTFFSLYVVAIILGILVVIGTSWTILCIGIIGIFVSLNYSLGKFPISYTPFGEAIAGTVMGYGIVQALVIVNGGSFSILYFWMGLPVIIMIALLLMTNNVSDIERDIISKRKTLPILLGRTISRKIIISCSQISLLLIIFIPYIVFHIISIVSIIVIIVLWNKVSGLKKYKFEYRERKETMTLVAKLTLLINVGYFFTLIEIWMRMR